MDWMEAVSNRWADKWMVGSDKNVFFRRFYVRPDEMMDRRYLLRWALWTGGILTAVPFFADAFTFVLSGVMISFLDRRFHIPAPTLASQLTREVRTFLAQLPWMSAFVFASFLLVMVFETVRAHYWNKRAQRLQLNPPSMPASMPGVWPPAPRI